MRKILFCVCFLLVCCAVYAQHTGKYKVNGKIEGMESGQVVMKQKTAEGYNELGVSDIKNGQFEFKGKIAEIQSVQLFFNNQRGSLTLFLEPGKIHVAVKKDSIYYGNVEGTSTNELWQYFNKEERRLESVEAGCAQAYQKAFATKDKEIVRAATRAFVDATKARKIFRNEFLNHSAHKYVAACFYRTSLMQKLQYAELDSLVKSYVGMENNNDVRLITQRRDLMRTVAVGARVPEINLPDVEGKFFALSSFRGKWVLLDFWASWCAPCRREGKHVLELYKKYQQDGFEVLGVSIDQNPDAWKQAIKEDQTPWKHVLDQRSEVAKTFGVSSVPRVFLISPEGIIVAVNLYGKELEQRLEKIFSK
ncbi:thiol:disulfide interchange protein [Odoribacteraceae bacterium]|uniref:TlpA disulfide reductase family protein n=1 Tax=Butyricimonas TaxID=574697 RepID=UPI0020852F47|nr:TlpA disulfide reductase family protein [Butyricimonas paravirosa]BDF55993.1 thiol:disulfide interchange protein [Odoribacteraceae bacterium]GKH94858.1 thiol:disulfide interchange protein [Odoribacteraceae bacterium]GKH97481.1 thiol:disulfide interchange protein [Odoribacteraceae bacterium]GKI01724.1 thiol:disulfide interchange protein [Odoribacteraceae bacterium]